ncbi:M55 family metallopeptidase [Clostridium sp. 19966]|uniref:M55 family metallopeptidase n=1 Tax=Clostridium sp. 19966 TaxID=2768166 RepID=UPI0028DFD9B8|nr:M55 family metallopeptidase [Clostridium sp. 19966]MDT8718397.1 M55 family metallopeptidase [Clostridium sp. 19966]
MKKQLIIVCDMEGASGIFDYNSEAKKHGTEEWRSYGKRCMTSDVLAVCEAANSFGIDEILIYDGHFAGEAENNIILEKLPGNAKIFDTPERRFFWRRIRGQAVWQPFGIITVGQHARFGEENAYFPHTIQSPPIKNLYLNGKHIAEIAQAVLSFEGTKYIANIGCTASMKEARELSNNVACIPVKDKSRNWEPSYEETYPIIKEGVLEALNDYEKMKIVEIEAPYHFSMELMEEYEFQLPEISWKGEVSGNKATWEAPSVEIGLELFNYVREGISKVLH